MFILSPGIIIVFVIYLIAHNSVRFVLEYGWIEITDQINCNNLNKPKIVVKVKKINAKIQNYAQSF